MCDVCTVEVPGSTSELQRPAKLHNVSRSGGGGGEGHTSGLSLQTVPAGREGVGEGLMLELVHSTVRVGGATG